MTGDEGLKHGEKCRHFQRHTVTMLSIGINDQRQFCSPQTMCYRKVRLQSLTVLTCSKYHHKCSATWTGSLQDYTIHFAG